MHNAVVANCNAACPHSSLAVKCTVEIGVSCPRLHKLGDAAVFCGSILCRNALAQSCPFDVIAVAAPKASILATKALSDG
jgi:hypothetical protein